MKSRSLIALSLLVVLSGAYAETPKTQLSIKATAPPLTEAAGDALTFEFKNAGKTFFLGRLPGAKAEATPSTQFLKADVKLPKAFHLRDLAAKLGVTLVPTYDQGQCGSCVYNSVSRNAADNLRLRKLDVPVLSRQYAMCLAQWSCSGSLFDNVASALVSHADVAESDYPYRAADAGCKDVSNFKKFGPFKSKSIIDNSPKSIMTALFQGYPVSVDVAADGPWSSYSGGIYNRNGSTSINHEVLIYGWDCETAVDADGNCDPSKISRSVGYAVMENSWGSRWGENGAMRTRWGMNALADEAGILESGIPLPDPTPPTPPTPPVTPIDYKLILSIVGAFMGLAALLVALLKK